MVQSIQLMDIKKEISFAADKTFQSGFEFGNWPIVIPKGKNDIDIVEAHWELISPWSKTMEEVIANRKKYNTLNAKGETLLSSKSYRDAALKRRCLILSSGFYEWRHFRPIGEKKELTYPYFITAFSGRPYFFIAGIFQPWTDKATGETMETFSLVTTNANSLMQQVHNTKKRMPTILTESLAAQWLMDDLLEDQITEMATYQMDSNDMKAYPIDKNFRTSVDPTEEAVYDELPILL